MTLKVKFDNKVKVVLIPKRIEYEKIKHDIWYSLNELDKIKKSFKMDINVLYAIHGENATCIWREKNCLSPSNNIKNIDCKIIEGKVELINHNSSTLSSSSNHGIFGFV